MNTKARDQLASGVDMRTRQPVPVRTAPGYLTFVHSGTWPGGGTEHRLVGRIVGSERAGW